MRRLPGDERVRTYLGGQLDREFRTLSFWQGLHDGDRLYGAFDNAKIVHTG